MFVRSLAGPQGALPVVLIHGWIASGGLNWFQAFGPLAQHFDVHAPDLRGHGRGIRTRRQFRLSECADDIAALLDGLATGPALIVGYSLGGPVAQLLWNRHPQKVAGLVMVATSERPVRSDGASRIFGGMMNGALAAGRVTGWSTWLPRKVAKRAARRRGPTRPPSSLPRWAGAEMGRHHVRHVLEAGAELGRYDARPWIGEIDVPTTVVVTERDRAVPARLQLGMAERIPGATIRRVDAGHLWCTSSEFGKTLVHTCRDLEGRIGTR